MVSTRSGNTPSKKSSHEAKASSIDETLEGLSLKSPNSSSPSKRTSRKPPRSRKKRVSVKPSPKVNGRKLRQDANATRQQQVKQQQIKDKRATSSTSSPSPNGHVGSDLVSTSSKKLLERKTEAAGLAKSLLSVIKKVAVVGPNEINKDM